MSNVVIVRNFEKVFYVTINRPDKLNALSIEVWHELGKAFDEFEKSDARVCVLRGAGDKAFVAGADIDAYRTMSAKEFSDFIVEAGKIADRIFEIPKPFIAAIYGYALGGGLELALHCDLIVANKSAKLGLPEANLGLLPGGGGTQIVPRLIGVAKANDMIMRGRWLRGEEALNAEYVSEVLKRAPLALGVLKNLVRQGLDLPFMDALKLEIKMTAPLIETADGREGVAAFIEKRAADFKGR